MKDLVPMGTGNSRFLKSNIPSTTTLAELITMFNNGTFPFDFNGLNAAGIVQEGDALNKNNLLPDDTVEKLGITGDNPQVKDAFEAVDTNAKNNINKAKRTVFQKLLMGGF